MEFRRRTEHGRRLLMELARVANINDPAGWLDTLEVREMKDGGMWSLELAAAARSDARSRGRVISRASVQFGDEDGVQVIATLNAGEDGVPFELDVWKTDFSTLKRIPTAFRRIEE